MREEKRKAVQDHARAIRQSVVEMIGCGGKVGHLGGSCSAAEVLAVLYGHTLRQTPQNPNDPQRDRFVMSKGHAVLAQYAMLARLGYFPAEELAHVKEYGSMLQGHPDRTKTPGIEANTGSLGQGLSLGLGMALGLRQEGRRVFVLLGDGETAEGQVWEAAQAAAHYGTGNLVAIVDANGVQASGTLEEILTGGDLGAKFAAFGWRVLEADGHDVAALADAFDSIDYGGDKPTALIARTVKGKHISFAEGKCQFHNSGLSQEQYEQARLDVENYSCEEGGAS